MKNSLSSWQKIIGEPTLSKALENAKLVEVYDRNDVTVELYSQVDQQGRNQRIMMAIPKNLDKPAPAVVIPFYFPEGMLGFNPKTNESIERYRHLDMMMHLVNRGYITISADAFYLTYTDSEDPKKEENPWLMAANLIYSENPSWTGVGRLISDTKLLVDLLVSDSRVDGERIGIAGHSLGGKMAFYTGCFDDRIKVIVASDFGFKWEQTNWNDPWYYGDKVETLKSLGMEHSQLLEIAQKPFCLIAGQYDDDSSLEAIRKAKGYETDEKLLFINHASGHYPTEDAINKGYDFIDKYLKG